MPTNLTCTVGNCPNKVKAKGLCAMHYFRHYRHGDVGTEARQNGRGLSPIEQLVAHVDFTGQCWLWTGNLQAYGYGASLPHRKSYRIFHGPIPEGYHVDHLCHNADPTCNAGIECLHRRCVNPDHLEAVPQYTNLMRGRSTAAKNAAKTHCPHGHPFDEENTLHWRRGRICKACRRTAVERRKSTGLAQ